MPGEPTPYISGTASIEYAAARVEQVRIRTSHVGLCFRCKYGFVTQRQAENEPRVWCGQISQRMPHDIAVCSKFIQSGQLSIFELIQLCDTIDVLSKQRVGFQHDEPR